MVEEDKIAYAMMLRRSEVATDSAPRVSDIIALSEGRSAACRLIIGTKNSGGGAIVGVDDGVAGSRQTCSAKRRS